MQRNQNYEEIAREIEILGMYCMYVYIPPPFYPPFYLTHIHVENTDRDIVYEHPPPPPF